MLAELASADAPRRRELLAAILDVSWKIGPNAAAAVPALIDWPLAGDRETEDEVCYALSNRAPRRPDRLIALEPSLGVELRSQAKRRVAFRDTNWRPAPPHADSR